jgi:DNA-binding MarR family transcriptional regulator
MIEQKKSSGKAAIIEALGATIVRWQDATQRYDEAVGEIYGLGPADRLTLSLLWHGPQTASAIARHTRLTPAAVTALIDRLEARGFLRRRPDPNDRRKVLVEAAEETVRITKEAYLPLQKAGEKNLSRYSEEQLRLVAELLNDSLHIQEQMTAELLARHGKS